MVNSVAVLLGLNQVFAPVK